MLCSAGKARDTAPRQRPFAAHRQGSCSCVFPSRFRHSTRKVYWPADRGDLCRGAGNSALGEVIAVDDASDDGTAAEIKALLGNTQLCAMSGMVEGPDKAPRSRTSVWAARYSGHRHHGWRRPERSAPLSPAFTPHGQSLPWPPASRAGRKGQGHAKAASRFANWLRDKVLADGCPDTGCGIKLFHRQVFVQLPFFTTMHRYLPALFLTYGHEIAYEAVNDRPRLRGASKYTNLGRALIGLYDLVGVSWLRKRTQLPPIAEEASGASAKPTAAKS